MKIGKIILTPIEEGKTQFSDSFYPRRCENYDKCTSIGCPHRLPHYTAAEGGNHCIKYDKIFVCRNVDIF